VVRSERGFIALALAGYAVPAALALRKFGRLASYHTWIGKTATATLSVGTLLLVMGWAHWPFRAGILLIVLACVEEFAISLVLSEPRSNVASFWHAQRPAKSSRRSA
jgi:CDP-diacylglycerol--glycerol-3-phosphate 3-phosphatidyltransferase